jgi:hypothetical protein
MSQLPTKDYSTPVLFVAAKILRTVTPDTLASLILVYSGTTTSQKEVADVINRDQSTVSTYFQSLTLEGAPVSLVVKPGLRYTVTDMGEDVIGFIHEMASHLGVELDTIDWGSASDKDQIGVKLLSPLHESRSVAPFFLLNSLGKRSIEARDDTSQPVWIDEVVHDVDIRLQELDKTTSKKQIHQIAERFADKDAISFNGTQLTLEKKGKEQAYLLAQLAEEIDKQNLVESAEDEGSPAAATDQTETALGGPNALDTDTTDVDHDTQKIDTPAGIRQQIVPQQSQGDELSSSSAQPSVQEGMTVMTVYCVRSGDETESVEESVLDSPVLPLTAITAGELIEKGRQIVQEYGEDAELVPYRMVQMNSKLYPLAPIDSQAVDLPDIPHTNSP